MKIRLRPKNKCRKCGCLLENIPTWMPSRWCRDCFRAYRHRKEKPRGVSKLKQQVILGYGGKCKCCGETTQEFLSIDHIGGYSSEHRLIEGVELGRNRGTPYKLLVELGYPTDLYQLLCFNCNMSLGLYGYCPHKK